MLALLGSRSGLSRAELAAAAGVSLPTLHRALGEVRSQGWIDARENSSAGQPEAVRLGRKAGFVLGMDVGRGHVRVSLADMHGDPIGEALDDSTTDPDHFEPDLLNTLADLLLDAVDQANRTAAPDSGGPYRLEEVRAIGVGIPFPVGRDGHTVGLFARGLSGLDLPRILRAVLTDRARERGVALPPQLTVRFARDAEVGARKLWDDHVQRCRRLGRDPREHSLVFLKASHGIDAGIVCHGELVSGARGLAGQIGHVWLPRLEGQLESRLYGAVKEHWPQQDCARCGRRLCLENVASGRAILRRLADSGDQGTRPTTVEELVDYVNTEQTQRKESRSALMLAAELIGLVLADTVRLADPAEIVVGGLLALTGETFLTPLRIAFAEAGLSGLDPEILSVAPERVKRIEMEGSILLALSSLSPRSLLEMAP